MKTIGIIGCGVVGSAVKEGMSPHFEVLTYDINKKSTCKSIYDLTRKVDGPIFICVPTSMNEDGSCDTSIVENVVSEINDAARYLYDNPIVVIKSTVIPGTTQALADDYYYLDICFNPEFLTERAAARDFIEQDRIIITGNQNACSVTANCYFKSFPDVPQYRSNNSAEGEFVKYFTNIHLAVKVSLANELKQICNAVGVDYETILGMALKDDRLGNTHWDVPGPDGKLGFGGTCFPKDLNALMYKARELEIDVPVMEGAWAKNLEVRGNDK